MKYGPFLAGGAFEACFFIDNRAAFRTSCGRIDRKDLSWLSNSSSDKVPSLETQISLTSRFTVFGSTNCLILLRSFWAPFDFVIFFDSTNSLRLQSSMDTLRPRKRVPWYVFAFFAAFRVLKSTKAKPLNFLFVCAPPASLTAWMSSAQPLLFRIVFSHGTISSTFVSYGSWPRKSVVSSEDPSCFTRLRVCSGASSEYFRLIESRGSDCFIYESRIFTSPLFAESLWSAVHFVGCCDFFEALVITPINIWHLSYIKYIFIYRYLRTYIYYIIQVHIILNIDMMTYMYIYITSHFADSFTCNNRKLAILWRN